MIFHHGTCICNNMYKEAFHVFFVTLSGQGQHRKVRHTWILDHPVTVVSLMKFHCRPMVVSERDPWRRCVPSLDSLSWDLTGGHKHLFIWAQNSLLPTCTYRLWIRWWNCVSQHVSHNVISADNYQLCWPPHHPHPQFIYLTFLHWFEIKVLRLFLHTYYKVSFRVGTGNVISWHWPNWILLCNYQQRHF